MEEVDDWFGVGGGWKEEVLGEVPEWGVQGDAVEPDHHCVHQ